VTIGRLAAGKLAEAAHVRYAVSADRSCLQVTLERGSPKDVCDS